MAQGREAAQPGSFSSRAMVPGGSTGARGRGRLTSIRPNDGRTALVPVPDVNLPDQSGTIWRLSDHRDGAVALVFYRGDW